MDDESSTAPGVSQRTGEILVAVLRHDLVVPVVTGETLVRREVRERRAVVRCSAALSLWVGVT